MPTIQISAKIIEWPPNCACCCGSADTTIPVGFTKTKGVKVVREESKSWDVPYCTHCLNHLQAEQAIAEAQRHAQDIIHGRGMPRRELPGGDTTMVLIFLAPILALVLFFLLPWVLMAQRINVVLAAFLAFAVGGPFVGAAVWGCWRWHQSESSKRKAREDRLDAEYQAALVEQKREQARAEQAAQEAVRKHQRMLRPGCAASGLAAAYEGWHGTVHTFQFRNPRFAAAFSEANPGKVVTGQMG